MKTQIKRMSKSTLAIVLTLCMLFSCATVGIIATDAAKVANGGSVGAYIADDASADDASDGAVQSAAVGAKADAAEPVGAAIGDDSSVGAADVYAVAGSWDNWTKHYFSGSTGSATVSVTLPASTSYTFKIYSSYNSSWYGGNTTFTSSGDYYFKTSEGNATLTTTYANSYTFTLMREDNNDGAVRIGVTFPSSSSGGSHADLKIYGQYNGATNWNNTTFESMTYMGSDSSGYSYYTFILNAWQQHLVKFYDGRKYYSAPQHTSGGGNYPMSTSRTSPTKNGDYYSYATDNDNNDAFRIDSSEGTKVVWARYNGTSGSEVVQTWCSKATFFLTGYINGADVGWSNNGGTSVTGLTTGFSGSGEEVTFSLVSETATQYVTVTDSRSNCYNVFHPTTHGSGSGTAADPTKTDSVASGPSGDKWLVTNAKGKTINFTWNMRTCTLSWTFGADRVSVYAKDGCAPIDWDYRNSNPKNNPGATGLAGFNYNNKDHFLYNFAAIATTTVASSDGSTFNSYSCDIGNATGYTCESKYQGGTVETGSTLTITTTITDSDGSNATDWRSKYYVRGWCINGVTYSGNNSNSVNTTVKDSGVYTMTYTVPEDLDKDADHTIEITPIYYFADNSNCITFYLEGFDAVKAQWGDTPFVYPFYGSLSGYQNSFGVYPGQPFVYVDGKYSTQIPLTSDAIYSGANDGTTIKGVTVSNGYADHVHRNLHYTTWQTLGSGGDGDDQYHMQTYDFDDFYKIYNEKRDAKGNVASSIILRLKNKIVSNNRNNYGGDNDDKTWSYTYTGNPSDSLTAATVQNIASAGNGWELLTDRYGRPVDLFGNVIGTTYSASAEAAKTAIRAISTGYNENIAGDYGTAWLIYTPNDNTCTASSGVYTCSTYTLQKDTATDRYAVPPSIFLLSSTNSFNLNTYPAAGHDVDGYTYTDNVNNYKSIYTNLKTQGDSGVNALGRYVYVSYEQNAQRMGSDSTLADYGAFRADARWYYTYATDMVNAKIKIQYYDGNKFVDEASYVNGYNDQSNQGTHTGCRAYFTNTAFDGYRESPDVLIDSGNFEFTARNAAGWKFDGWYIEYDGGDNYSQISSSVSASTPMSASDVLVARFEPVTSGQLNISHTIGTDATHTGTGTAALRVRVYTDNTKASIIYDSGSTTDDVLLDENYISNTFGNFYIDVTLTTTPAGDDLMKSITYDRFNSDKGITATTTGTLNTSGVYSSNFGFTVSQLFTNSNQDTLSLSYVSYLDAAVHNYVITYSYASRGSDSNDKSFTVKGTFTSREYETYVDTSVANVNDRTVSNAFIKSKAPFESNFMKTLTLDYDHATQTCTAGPPVAHTITISFTSSDSKDRYAIFDLPYMYQTSTGELDGVAYKAYTAIADADSASETFGKILKNDHTASFELDTTYLAYFTSTGEQTRVNKDIVTPNHTGNDFITAPEVIWDAENTQFLYFNYWQIYKTDRTTEITKVYYEDFNYLAYDNYYVKPVYTDIDHVAVREDAPLAAGITYLESSRNQWNTNDGAAHAQQSYASDLIYNDFAISFTNGDELIKKMSTEDVQIGIIFERIAGSDAGASASVSDMGVYKTMYGSSEAASKDKVTDYLTNGTEMGLTAFNQALEIGDLNNKNRMEKHVSFYSRYGQDADLNFANDSAVDNYVYRAYAYIKLKDGSVAVSDPAYFSMKYTANLSYSGS